MGGPVILWMGETAQLRSFAGSLAPLSHIYHDG